MDGGPVIGCGALFISWSSAWGGRCGPVYKSEKRNEQRVKLVFGNYITCHFKGHNGNTVDYIVY